jgi:RNA-directed DNA polymerase
MKFAEEHNITMTTFIDDLTLSSSKCFKDIVPHVIDIIKEDGFTINHKKTFYKTNQPIVTGVISAQNGIKVPSEITKKLAQTEGKTQAQIDGLKRYVHKVEFMNKNSIKKR